MISLLFLALTPFSANVEVIPKEVEAPMPITIDVHLTFPAGSPPDRETMRKHLLQNASPWNPPFFLTSEETLREEEEEQHIRYILRPLRGGDWLLSLLGIPFLGEEENIVWTPVDTIHVTMPNYPENLLLVVEPPLPLEDSLQKLYLDERNHLEQKGRIGSEEAHRAAEILAARQIPWKQWIGIGCLLLFFLSLPGLLLQFLTWWKKRGSTPDKKASRNLQQLEKKDLPREQRYSAMVDVVRSYVEERYGWHAHHQTAREFRAEKKVRSDEEDKVSRLLSPLMQEADAIKFQQKTVSEKRWQRDWETVTQYFKTDQL